MQLSISNIGWISQEDETVYSLMKKYGYSGLEIAPTRILPEAPYDKLDEARQWRRKLEEQYSLKVPSMQSIWFGRGESLFGTEEERQILADYTRKAVDFAVAIGCHNLVFGCPRNRNMPEGADRNSAVSFFREVGNYAVSRGTVIGMEANPPIYNTNYINDTVSALELIREVDSKGFLLNLDIGTMVQNGEQVEVLEGETNLINHVHISEPGLKPIEERPLHTELRKLLKATEYKGYISIEMAKQEDLQLLEEKLAYVSEVFAG